jgi:hypothetical protein
VIPASDDRGACLYCALAFAALASAYAEVPVNTCNPDIHFSDVPLNHKRNIDHSYDLSSYAHCHNPVTAVVAEAAGAVVAEVEVVHASHAQLGTLQLSLHLHYLQPSENASIACISL